MVKTLSNDFSTESTLNSNILVIFNESTTEC